MKKSVTSFIAVMLIIIFLGVTAVTGVYIPGGWTMPFRNTATSDTSATDTSDTSSTDSSADKADNTADSTDASADTSADSASTDSADTEDSGQEQIQREADRWEISFNALMVILSQNSPEVE